MEGRRILRIVAAAFLIMGLIPMPKAHAYSPTGELSFMGSFSKTNYGNNTYTTSRRYTASAGMYLTPMTELELSYTSVDSFFNYDPVQTTTINEQTLSLSVVQALVPQSMVVQPYVKGGLAQYNRKQSGTVGGIPTQPTESKSPSAVIGGGLRVFLLQNFSLKAEAVTYLPDMNFTKASDNFSVQGGISWSF